MIDPDEDDEIEPLGDRIDLGLVAIEALALALPPYPRKPGATLGPATAAARGAAPLEESALKPFAALAALRGKMGEGIVRIDARGLARARAISMVRGSFSCPVRQPWA